MTKIRHLLAGAALVACALAAQADEGMTVVVTNAEGEMTEVVASDITSINFLPTSVELAGPANKTWFRSEVLSIKFKTSSMGLKPAIADACALSLRIEGDALRVAGYGAGMEPGAEIYNLAGVKTLGLPAWRGEDIDVSGLPQGAYMLRVNNTTLKFIKR